LPVPYAGFGRRENAAPDWRGDGIAAGARKGNVTRLLSLYTPDAQFESPLVPLLFDEERALHGSADLERFFTLASSADRTRSFAGTATDRAYWGWSPLRDPVRRPVSIPRGSCARRPAREEILTAPSQ
jgi:hypothetical protein